MSEQDGDRIREAIPREVVEMGLDPVVALLVTLYVFYIGQIVGEEMAATVGFPSFRLIAHGGSVSCMISDTIWIRSGRSG